MPVIAGAIIGKKIYDAHKRRKKKKEKFQAEKAASRKEAGKRLDEMLGPNRDKLKLENKTRTLELKTSKKRNERRYGQRI